MMTRRKTRQIQLGKLKVGGDAPITVQSMTKTDTRDVQATLLQIWALEAIEKSRQKAIKVNGLFIENIFGLNRKTL